MAVNYINARQTTDGGYFFARVPPGNLQDAFFAVESLKLMGFQPHHKDKLERFVLGFQPDYANGNIHALYLAASIFKSLGKSLEEFYKYGESALYRFSLNELARFDRLDSETVSELKHIYEAVTVFNLLNVEYDKQSVAEFIFLVRNLDGGFGRNGFSTLATTCYAIQTLTSLDYPQKYQEQTREFLIKMEKEIYYIEDLFYYFMSRTLLGERLFYPERMRYAARILEYQRENGGFARARPIGISTLEYTYYAISVLKSLQAV